MVLRAPGEKLRFQIVENGIAYSDSWSAWQLRGDVYLAAKGTGATSKVSLHKSGDCRWALTQQLASHAPPIPADNRKICAWHREMNLSGIEHTQVLSLRFIPITRGASAGHIVNQKARFLPYPPKQGCLEICVFYCKSNPYEWNSKHWVSRNILGVWELSKTEYVTFRWRTSCLPDQERARLMDAVWSAPSVMITGEEDPCLFSAGLFDVTMGRALKKSGQIDTLLAVHNKTPGRKASWHTTSGHKLKKQ